ncbi:MAG: cell wall hydrolase [Eubacterium sp.]|nr:cell wall hydrolase [Eubacterium sp.]
MSFKKVFAGLLTLATLASIGAGTPALAAEETKAQVASSSSLGCIVGGVVTDSVNGEEATATVTEDQVPLSSASGIAADQKAEAEKDKEVEKEIAAQKKAAKKNYKKALRLLAAIVYCEAGGQCYAGRLAVAAVVMNRVESKGYPNTIHDVLWQPYQFGPIRQGKMARELRYYDKGLYNQPERKGSLQAAKDILAGKYTVKYQGKTIDLKKYHNFNGHLSNAKIRISGHDFA